MLKKTLVAAAVTLATTTAFAGPIQFDTNGSAAGGVVTITEFTWQPGNALVVGALSTTPVLIGGVPTFAVKTVAQARLASYTLALDGSPVSLPAGTEITYQATIYEYVTGIGGATVNFSLDPNFTSTFKLFYDNNATTQGNFLTGANYGSEGGAIQILSGNITFISGAVSDLTTTNSTLNPIAKLDTVAPDTGPNTRTHQLRGNNDFEVDVLSSNSSFFKSNIDSLTVDLLQNVGISAPFNQGNPWATIVGETPFFTRVTTGPVAGQGRINGAACTAAGGQSQAGVNNARCDLLLQTTGTTSFITEVPEPGSIALVGLALAGLGFATRRKAASK